MRKEEDPGSPAMLLEDLDQAWMVGRGGMEDVLIMHSSPSGEELQIRALFPTLVVSSREYVYLLNYS